MRSTIINRRITWVVCVLFVLLAVVLSGRVVPSAFAATEYTEVMTDLTKDSTFTTTAYPKNPIGYSLEVIQIAESTDGELFVYVYNPSAETKPLKATSIRFSTAINENYAPKDYTLSRLSYDGVFAKYKVNGFAVKADTLRYYDIVCIFRAWDKTIDKGTGNDNTISEVPHEVGKLYTASTVNGNVTYTCTASETVEVTNKYCGTLLYKDSFHIGVGNFKYEYTASHYVAFSTDWDMDELYEADVEYSLRHVTAERRGMFADDDDYVYTYGQAQLQPVITLSSNDSAVSNPVNGWWGQKHTWQTIQPIADFMANEQLTAEAKTKLANKQWVLRFSQTPYTIDGDTVTWMGKITKNYDEACDVSILRLKFEVDGKVYNLGVVDNKQTGNKVSNVINTIWNALPVWAWVFIILFAVGLLLGVLSIFFKPLAAIFKGLLFILSLPFRGIAWLFKRKGGDK